MKQTNNSSVQVPLSGYIAFFFAILLFSGIFSSSDGWMKALDFNVLNGSFGKIEGIEKAFTFRGAGGSGARDGFLFAFELIPAVILALGLVNVIDGLGGLKAAQKLMSPILKPLLGVPGVAALANIANMQSTDAAAGMVKELVDTGELTDKERSVIISYQTSGSAFITNYFSSGAAVFSFMLVPIIVPILVILVFKIVGANLMRLYLKAVSNKPATGGNNHDN
ncbi:nucleoside recognition domain-containing protein [Anaerosinus massiliensis]|uniref:nucleoside recognition domain-containing protein n=1 Tax=Massilibacillus massiliensis TaxID=1806837 RepID=UPI000A8ED740|nr:nucleoside recognition domain-containing protein [Massilibacillus massiliensis]